MTAEEALELKNGSIKRKGAWFKLRLAWACGKLNKDIEYSAEHGDAYCEYTASRSFAKQYYPVMAKIYEDRHFFIAYTTKCLVNSFIVVWDFNSLTQHQKFAWTNGLKHIGTSIVYDHYTKGYRPER